MVNTMFKKSGIRGVVKDLVIVAAGVIVIWVSIMAVFGTENPFYVVASRSMVPELEVYDVLIVQGHAPFEEVAIGDIIVFDRPSDHDRVIVHRVASIIEDDPRTLRTKGDANSASIPGTDFPITSEEYIGTVAYVIPQIGYATQIIKPPINYIIIVIVIGIMIAKQLLRKKDDKSGMGVEIPKEPSDPDRPADLGTIKRDTEYSKDVGRPSHVDAPPKDKPDKRGKK